MPNFLIIGAQKAGTTSLYSYINQHPQVYMSSVKEPHFFALEKEKVNFNGPFRDRPNLIVDLASYQSLFKNVTNQKAIGEASTWYLHSPKAVEGIRHHLPHVKLIAILRDPVERALSNYWHCRRRQMEPCADFVQALEAEANRRQNHWGHPWYYQEKGLYYLHLKRYFDCFERQQIKVFLTEDLSDNPVGLSQDIFRFLQVDPNYIPDVSERKNTGDRPPKQSASSHQLKLLKSVIKPFSRSQVPNRKATKPTITPELRQQIIQKYYREDILKLENLIQRDLSRWLK